MDNETLIRSLRRENELLHQEIERLNIRIKRDFMERAVKDEQLSKTIASQMEQFYDGPISPWFICILFFGGNPALNETPAEAPLDSVSNLFYDTLDNYGQPYFFEATGTVCCLLNAELEEDPQFAPEVGKTFCRHLRDTLSEVYNRVRFETDVSHIAISHVAQLPQGPRALYRSALSVAERRTHDAPAVCMEEGWVSPSLETMTQIFSLEPTFWRQIQQHAFYDATTTMDQIIQLTCLEQGSLDRTLASVFSRMELVLQATMQENGSDLMQDPEFSVLLHRLSTASTYQEVRDATYDILATLEDRFYTPPNTRNKKMSGIEEYIAQHYTDQMLCASSIAEAFRISPSYLSRIFKADLGIGIVDYIHKIRVEAAKEALMDPTLTMDAVAAKAGFSNRWVLTRVFKKVVGVPPGSYRSNPS